MLNWLYSDPTILKFVNDIKDIYNEKRADIDLNHVLERFNELNDIEKASIILSIITDDKFRLSDHPDVLNQVELIKIKRYASIWLMAFFIITYLFTAGIFGGLSDEIMAFVNDKIYNIRDLFYIIFF